MTTTTVKFPSMTAVLSAIPRQTVKGEAIARLASAAYGTDEVAVLRLASDVVDRTTITVGRDSFQLVVINTDTTVTSTTLDNTNAESTQVMTAHGLLRGAILRCENEFMQVKRVVDANTVLLTRGYAGSTKASHTDGAAIYKKAATALTAGKIYVPLGATLTPAAAGPQIAAGMSALDTLGWTWAYTTNTITGYRAANGLHDALSETLAGTNNVWAASASWGGIESAAVKQGVAVRVPTAEEVTLGYLTLHFPFTVVYARVTVVTTATGAAIAWDGATTLSGGLVTLGNAGSVDWADSTTVFVEAFGA